MSRAPFGELVISSLGSDHARQAFDCGEPALNDYLHHYAGQDVRRQVSRVFVASPMEDPARVLGYYSLSAVSLVCDSLPEQTRRRLPRYPVPVARLGRLAVDLACQNGGLGGILLADALQRVLQASEILAVHAVVVDAIDESAVRYYQRFGFQSLPKQPLKLFLPVATIRQAVGSTPESA